MYGDWSKEIPVEDDVFQFHKGDHHVIASIGR